MTIGAPRCPAGGKRIDENSARFNAAITCAVLVAALLTPFRWILAYLVIDFGIKVLAGVFLLFAFFEAAFGFCMGCWIYTLLPERVAALLVRRSA